MRNRLFVFSAVSLAVAVWAVPIQAEERSLAILFRPSDAEPARAAAKAASASARHWLQTPGSSVEIQRGGGQDALPVSGKSSAKNLEKAFVELALQAEDTNFSSFLTALEASVQSLAQKPGTRLMVVALKSPPASSDDENALGVAMSVHVVAHFNARPETAEAVREIVTGFIEPTRKEAGCITYVLVQNDADPLEFTFVEEWASGEALDDHLRTPHLKQGAHKLAELLSKPGDIRRYSPIG